MEYNPYVDRYDYLDEMFDALGGVYLQCKFCEKYFATTTSQELEYDDREWCYDDECRSLGEKELEEELLKVQRVQRITQKETPEEAPVPRSPRPPREKPVYEHPRQGGGGYIYLVAGESGLYKIGISKDVKKRFKGIQAQSPVQLSLIHHFYNEDYRVTEKLLHVYFAEQRQHFEWFDLTDEQVAWFCELRDGVEVLTDGVYNQS